MKQTALLRWIETAERDRFCRLADEDPARAKFRSTPTGLPPFDVSILRRQLCLLVEVSRLTSRSHAARGMRISL
jgi:hypothetical protein